MILPEKESPPTQYFSLDGGDLQYKSPHIFIVVIHHSFFSCCTFQVEDNFLRTLDRRDKDEYDAGYSPPASTASASLELAVLAPPLVDVHPMSLTLLKNHDVSTYAKVYFRTHFNTSSSGFSVSMMVVVKSISRTKYLNLPPMKKVKLASNVNKRKQKHRKTTKQSQRNEQRLLSGRYPMIRVHFSFLLARIEIDPDCWSHDKLKIHFYYVNPGLTTYAT